MYPGPHLPSLRQLAPSLASTIIAGLGCAVIERLGTTSARERRKRGTTEGGKERHRLEDCGLLRKTVRNPLALHHLPAPSFTHSFHLSCERLRTCACWHLLFSCWKPTPVHWLDFAWNHFSHCVLAHGVRLFDDFTGVIPIHDRVIPEPSLSLSLSTIASESDQKRFQLERRQRCLQRKWQPRVAKRGMA